LIPAEDKTDMKYITRLFLVSFVIMAMSCMNLKKELPDGYSYMKILLTRSEYGDRELIVKTGLEDYLFESLQNSKESSALMALKESIVEGVYVIKIYYPNSVKTFIIDNTEDVFYDERKKMYKNKTILRYLRTLLLKDLLVENEKLRKTIQDK
jgi:hypothetical protein